MRAPVRIPTSDPKCESPSRHHPYFLWMPACASCLHGAAKLDHSQADLPHGHAPWPRPSRAWRPTFQADAGDIALVGGGIICERGGQLLKCFGGIASEQDQEFR